MASPNIANKQLISASNVTFERSGQALLKDINLSIASGMITVLLGHNGAGKTLLMQVMHGLLMPSSGTISSIGRTGQKMVFQKPVMLRRTAGQYFDFICPDCPAHIKQDWFHKAGLTGRTATPSRLLSGGEQQKLSLISVLATQPKLLFLDEPCANLDFEAIDFVEAELLAARETGMTIIMSSHSRHQAQKLADYIILMRRGRIAEYAEKEAFFLSPESDAGKEYLSYS
ncbi:MAG: ATP-binding cassette domain-containing protein [Candidatus Puniceispirillaceae bacterium]|jgi:tungstate transport system ATP-binding protein|nr:ABC transporter ATP-binding protein [Pseudomonadota bacterium]